MDSDTLVADFGPDAAALQGGALILLGRYRLQERLGAGGFGVVWRAHDEVLHREVALKRIFLPANGDRERATREALATARLSHPAIVALYEACSEEDAFYLISELVAGDTLAHLIVEGSLCDQEIIEIGIVLADALEHAHARGVIHRDVKPQNVIVPHSADPPAKLADFGGALLAGEDALTRTGDVFGTLAYMAPEQSEGAQADERTDLYSLALVLYEALSGLNPVRGPTPAATARRIGRSLPPLERHRRDLPRELTEALDQALAVNPRRRGTLTHLHDALAGALDADRAASAPRKGSRARPVPAPVRHETLPQAALPAEDIRPARSDSQPEKHDEADSGRRLFALPRILWLGLLGAAILWQALAGRPGLALVLLAASVPLLALPRRSSPWWLAALFAPVLGLAALAGAFPAVAAQGRSWRARAGLGALGYWWLVLAELLLARRLWLGAPPGVPPRAQWEGSLQSATHAIAPLLSVGVLMGACLWAIAAILLPWIVRGRSATFDLLAAALWSAALLAAAPLLDYGLPVGSGRPLPHGAVPAAIVGALLVVGARALRGPSPRRSDRSA